MEGSIVYSQSEFIQVFFKKGTNSHSIAKLVPELLEFHGKNPSVPLFKNEALMMRHTNFLLSEIFKEVAFLGFKAFPNKEFVYLNILK
ncbi:hypothetical protein ABH916_002323 [Peribacillus frigoritolerans]